MDNFKRAIPTVYNGTQFKSRMEAQCAFLFDQLGWKWEYETESLMLSSGVTYIPDFSISGGSLIVECRGYENERGKAQIAGFIADLNKRSIAKDEYCSFLLLGPERCTLFESNMVSVSEFPARVTFCPRCDEWNLHTFVRSWKDLCPCCIELTFNDYPITVDKGKFFFGHVPLDEVGSAFDKGAQRTGWAVRFQQHILHSLNKYHPSDRQHEILGNALREIILEDSK